jgi:hypothetical protein
MVWATPTEEDLLSSHGGSPCNVPRFWVGACKFSFFPTVLIYFSGLFVDYPLVCHKGFKQYNAEICHIKHATVEIGMLDVFYWWQMLAFPELSSLCQFILFLVPEGVSWYIRADKSLLCLLQTGNILAPMITHTLYSIVIVGNGLRRIHDNREKLRQRVNKIAGQKLASIGVQELGSESQIKGWLKTFLCTSLASCTSSRIYWIGMLCLRDSYVSNLSGC